jgi:hypothetical protein
VYGWLLTDGSVSANTGQIRIQLKHIDRDVLEKIKRVMQFTGNIYYSKLKDGRESYYLRVCRRSMISDLCNLGMPMQAKTFNAMIPKGLPEYLFWDFMRGVTEGDGNLKHGKQWNDMTVSVFSASLPFLPEIQRRLADFGINTTLIERPPGTSGSKEIMYTLRTKANADALRWCYLMYQNTTDEVRLDRKFGIFTNYVAGYYDRKRRSRPSIEAIEMIREGIPECNPSQSYLAA